MNPVQQLFKKIWLKIHLKIHTEERPYWCTYCNKAFSGNSDLKCYQMAHPKEEQYKCNHCGKPFFIIIWFKIHRRTHNGGNHINAFSVTRLTQVIMNLTVIKGHTLGRRKYINATIVAKLFSFIIWFKNSHENTHWRKTMSMHPLWLGLLML